MEQFKPIKGYEGRYEISNFGHIKFLYRNGGILKTRVNKIGYERATLLKETVIGYFSVHRLVAQYFIDNPHGYDCVGHKDNNRLNNHADNLEWCTHQQNSSYMVAQRRQAFGEKNAKAKLKESDVTEIMYLRKTGLTLQAIADNYGVTKQSIHAIIKGESWSYLDKNKVA